MRGLIRWLLLRKYVRRLERLEKAGAAASPNARMRRAHADQLAIVRGPQEALPLYDAIVRDFPDDRRHLQAAAEVRLEAGDPAGAAALEQLASAHPGMAPHCYAKLRSHYAALGDGPKARRFERLGRKARIEGEDAAFEGRLLDPGGDIRAVQLDSESWALIDRRLPRIEGLKWLRAGERVLDAGGFRQFVLLFEVSTTVRDEPNVYARLCDLWDGVGDSTIWCAGHEWDWLSETLAEFPSQLYP